MGGPSLLPRLDEGGCEIPQDCLEESPWKSLYFAQKLEAKQKASYNSSVTRPGLGDGRGGVLRVQEKSSGVLAV